MRCLNAASHGVVVVRLRGNSSPCCPRCETHLQASQRGLGCLLQTDTRLHFQRDHNRRRALLYVFSSSIQLTRTNGLPVAHASVEDKDGDRCKEVTMMGEIGGSCDAPQKSQTSPDRCCSPKRKHTWGKSNTAPVNSERRLGADKARGRDPAKRKKKRIVCSCMIVSSQCLTPRSMKIKI